MINTQSKSNISQINKEKNNIEKRNKSNKIKKRKLKTINIDFSNEINDILNSYQFRNTLIYKQNNKINNTKKNRKNLKYKLMDNNTINYNNNKKLTLPFVSETINLNDNYYIVKGKNKRIIKKILETRENWKEIKNNDKIFNKYNLFLCDNSSKINYDDFSYFISKENKFTNHFEYHSSLTNKIFLFYNLMKYCEKYNKNVFNFFPFTIIIDLYHFSYIEQIVSFKNLFFNIQKFIGRNNKINKSYSQLFYLNSPTLNLGFKTKIYFPINFYYNKNLWMIKFINIDKGKKMEISDSWEKIDKLINDLTGNNELKKKNLRMNINNKND